MTVLTLGVKMKEFKVGDIVIIKDETNICINKELRNKLAKIKHNNEGIITINLLPQDGVDDTKKNYVFLTRHLEPYNQPLSTSRFPDIDIDPKDGDDINSHEDHEIVDVGPISPGGKGYKYCRDCKVEVVKKEPGVFLGAKATISVGGKVIGKLDNVQFVAGSSPQNIHPDNANGVGLDKLAARCGLKRTIHYNHPDFSIPRTETDNSLRNRVKKYLDIRS